MLALDPSQKSSTFPGQAINASDDYCAVTKIAIHAIRALGVILMAAAIGCIVAGFQVPPIALLVTGAAALILGFVLDKSREENSVLQSETDVLGRKGISENSPQETISNPLLDPPEEPGSIPKPAIASFFGKEEWIQHIGDPGKVPPLPTDIETILKQPCPFSDDKTVAETHMLVLIPEAVTQIVGDEPRTLPFTLRNFRKLVKISNPDAMVTCEQNIGTNDLKKNSSSHWILITKNVLPRSRYAIYEEQKQRVEAAGYEIPSALEVATAILFQNIHFRLEPFIARCLQDAYGQNLIVESVVIESDLLEPNLRIEVFTLNKPEQHGIVAMKKF